ncbi:hypothetical protein EDB80DRAFT_897396 [Ilyonectria destructans]|nr:hypothetical protein EDB80DRAFT_897396 [Ilyonectria destructans]
MQTAAVKADTENYAQAHSLVVIGAGFTGLAAARDLSLKGHSGLLLDARDRIGGRAWSSQGKHQEYEMEKSLSLDPDTPMCINSAQQDLRGADDSFLPLVASFFDVDGQGGRNIFPQPHRPLENAEGVAQRDISVEERINQLNLSAAENKLMTIWMATMGLAEVSQVGFLSVLRLYALSGYDFPKLLEMNGTFKIQGGTMALANAMFAEFKGAALFNRKAKLITSQSVGARVVIEGGETFTANRVISTVPVNCLADVQFSPPLAPFYTSVIHTNLGGKIHAHSTNNSVKFFGVASPQSGSSFGFSESWSTAKGTSLLFFPSSRADAKDGSALDSLNQSIDNLVPKSVQVGSVDDFVWHDWRNDELSKGAWAVFGPGALSRDLGSLMRGRRVSNSVTLASSDFADGWVGYIDGAIGQGRRTAFQIENSLVAFPKL